MTDNETARWKARAGGMHKTALAMRDAAIFWQRETGVTKHYHAIERMYFDAALGHLYTNEYVPTQWSPDGERIEMAMTNTDHSVESGAASKTFTVRREGDKRLLVGEWPIQALFANELITSDLFKRRDDLLDIVLDNAAATYRVVSRDDHHDAWACDLVSSHVDPVESAEPSPLPPPAGGVTLTPSEVDAIKEQQRELSQAIPEWAQRLVVVDTETSDLFDMKLPADDPSQGRLAELAMIFLNPDLTEERAYQCYVKPDGWEMQPGATAANGLTTEFLMQHGKPIQEVLAAYEAAIEAGYCLVGWNMQFDGKVCRGEFRRLGLPDLFEQTKNVCAMRASTNVLKLPAKNGRGYKWPKLSEACEAFGIPLPSAHTAVGDATATAEIVRRLIRTQSLPAPSIHYAKNRPTPSDE